jgi:hypothetical protein
MAKKTKQMSLLVVLAPMLILLGASIYFSRAEWQKYSTNLAFTKQLTEIETIEKLNKNIINEIVCVAKLSRGDENIRDACREARAKTDAIFLSLDTKTYNETLFEKLTRYLITEDTDKPEVRYSPFEDLAKEIKNIRYDVDSSRVITIDTLITGDYFTKLLDPIVAQIIKALEIIHDEEIDHVRKGDRWFRWLCQQRGLDYRETFVTILDRYHLRKKHRPHMNIPARKEAGFACAELLALGAKECD